MNENTHRIVRNTPEEEAELIAGDPDTYEWTEEVWARAKSADQLFPELVKWSGERKTAAEAGLIECVTITLDRETIDWFKSRTGEDGETGGTRWMMLIEKTLREHARRGIRT